jgi:ubiquinone/menaquinone biosynthesis C-methylase UbiE
MERPQAAADLLVKMKVAALFDSLALEYVRERERQFSFIAQKRLALELLAGVRGRVLEVGCGPAVMAPDLAAMGFEVQGIDVSGEMIYRAQQRMTGNPWETRCKFAVGDIESLQYADASFDAVLGMGVLEYLPSYAQALRETARVLKPGGIAVFTVPNRMSSYHVTRSVYELARAAVRRAVRGRQPARFKHNWCVPWMLDHMLAQAGLHKVDCAACNFIFFPLKELHAGISDSLNRAMMPLARSRVARLFGAQYIVKARNGLTAQA